MKNSVLVLFSCLVLSAAFAVSADAQSLTATVTVVPSVTISFAAAGGLAVTSNTVAFGSWGAYGNTSGGGVTFVPPSGGAFSVYTPISVTVTGANATTYGLTAQPSVPTAVSGTISGGTPALLVGTTAPPAAVSTSSPTTIVATGTTASNTTGVATTVYVGYQVPTALVKSGGGSFGLTGTINFTASAN